MEKSLAIERDVDIEYDSFDAMNLKEDLLRGIYEYGYKKPYLIQQRGIVPFSEGVDLIMMGMFGPSRTSTYCIGVLQQIKLDVHKCQCLILVFTSGRVPVVAATMQKLGKFMGVKVHECFKATDDISTSHVVVVGLSTAHAMVERKLLYSEEMKMVVLDQADTLMKFESVAQEVYDIIESLLVPGRKKFQFGAFCETMPENSPARIRKMMMNENPLLIYALKNDEGLGLYGIHKHKFLNVEKDDLKAKTVGSIVSKLMEMRRVHGIFPTMIFVSKRKLKFLADTLVRDGYTFTEAKRNMDQNEIDATTRHFLYSSGVILTTFSCSRGIIENCSDEVRFIVNYDICDFVEAYDSRVGWFRGVDASICLPTCDNWDDLVLLQERYDIVFESVHLSQNWADIRREEPVIIIRDQPIRHCIFNLEDEKGKVNALSLPGCVGLYDEFDIARTSVIFVNSSERIVWLANKLRLHSKYTVITSEPSLWLDRDTALPHQDHDTTRPRLFITTDNLYPMPIMEVPLVINFDLPLALVNYHRRVAWCRSNGIFLLLGTEEDWFKILDMQALYRVSFRWVPSDVADILKEMVLAETGPSTSKKPRALGQFKN